MFFIKFAFKNLIRHRKRTFITAVIIASAILVFLLIDSLLIGLNNASYDNIINYSTSEIQIVKSSYWKDRKDFPLNNLIEENKNHIYNLNNNSNIAGVTKKLVFRARINNGVDELPIKAIGIEGQNIDNTLNLKNSIIKGSYFTGAENKAVLGKSLADLMDVRYKDYITLLFRTKENTFNTLELEIAGIINTPNPNVNQNNIYLPLKIAQNSLNLNNKFSHILIKTSNKNQINNTVVNIENNFLNSDNFKIIPWNDLTAVSVINSKQGANKIILGIILLLAAIGIINTVILSALERTEEIGMMKAMGMKKNEIIFSFVLESMGVGILGGIIGCSLGILGVLFLNTFGINFSAIYQINMVDFGIPVADKIYGAWNLNSFIFVFGFSVIISIGASIFPAYWAAQKNSIEAIHHR